ncbi:MAG: DUF1573 domain-containing protein [Cytophagales bacterium]
MMKKLIAILTLIMLVSCETKEEKSNKSEEIAEVEIKDSLNAPKMQFQLSSYDFGKVKMGDIVKYSFQFTNSGTEPLIISNAYASCGCTVPTWTKEPIAPGKTGEIYVEFNTAGKKGVQNKKINIKANTVPEDNFVELNGVVEE